MGALRRMTRSAAAITLGFFAGCAAPTDDAPVSNDVTVIPEIHHDTSPPLRDIQPIFPVASFPVEAEPVMPIPRPAPLPDQAAPRALQVLTEAPTGPLAPTTVSSFDGIGDGVFGFVGQFFPPDTDGDV